MTPRITIAALVVALSAPASANVNLTGHFVGAIGSVLEFGPFPCESIDVTQSGTAISLTASCDVFGTQTFAASGTIDSATGAFTATGQGSILCTAPGSLTLSGYGLPDSYSFYGSLVCGVPDLFTATRCGNGILDAGESQACDDAVAGNLLSPPGCCSNHCDLLTSGTACFTNGGPSGVCDAPDFCNGSSPTCPDLKAPNGTPCDDFNVCTRVDSCQSGQCLGGMPAPAGTDCLPDFIDVPCIAATCDSAGGCFLFGTTGDPCDDGDACTTGDTCNEGYCQGGPPPACNACQTCDSTLGCVARVQPGCKKPVASRSPLELKDGSPDDKDHLSWKWLRGAATTTAEFGDPVSGTDYTLCVYDDEGSGPHLLVAAEAPAGTSWRAKASGFKYKTKSGGLQTVALKAGSAGKAKIMVKGAGGALGLPLTLAWVGTPVVVQLKAENGSCWEADYSTALRSNPVEFSARGGSPGGAFLDD